MSFVRRYKAKHVCDKTQYCRSNILDFLLFMCFWIFDTKQVKIDKKEQTFKAFFKKKNKNSKNMLELKHKQTTKQCPNISKELMHGHVLMLMHVYPSSRTCTCIWGKILRGLGT